MQAQHYSLDEDFMKIPEDLKYTASHEWVRTETDGTITVGITDHANRCWETWSMCSCPRLEIVTRKEQIARWLKA
jgi:glycine cleavage system H lipoate-binding protein